MANTTESTVVAVFSNSADAQAAASELKSTLINSEDIHISSGNSAAASAAAQTGYSETQAPHVHEGGIKGWFKSLFGSDEHEDADYYDTAVSGGKTLLTVDAAEEDIDEVVEILNRHSPVDVHEQAGAGTASTRNISSTSASASGTPTTRGNESGAIPVVEEELQVGKRSVLRGGVRVYSRVVEEPIEESVRLRQEQVRVDRQPVNRAATEADLRAGEQQVVEVTEYAEEPVVSKQARVVEEVRVGKDATERTETVRDTVRRTEVEVENLNDDNPQSSAGRKPGVKSASNTN